MKRTLFCLIACLVCPSLFAQNGVVLTGAPWSIAQWIDNGCYPWYGAIVPYGTMQTPPCPGESVLLVIRASDGQPFYLGPTGYSGGPSYGDGPAVGGFNIPPTGTTGSYSPYTQQNGVQQISNNGSAGQVYMQTANGQPTGNFLYVPSGGTGSMPIFNAQSGTTYGAVPVNPGPGDINGGTSTQNPDGTVNLTGATVGPALGGNATGSPFTLGNNSDNPLLTNGITIGSPGPPGSTTLPTPTNAPATSGNPTGGTAPMGTNVNLTAPGAPASSNLNNGTFQSGIQVLYSQNQLDVSAIVDAIHQLDAHNQQGQAGISNGIIGEGNTTSNLLSSNNSWLSGIYSNTLPATNVLQLTNVQDQAATAAANLSNDWNGAIGGLPAQPAVDSGSDDSLSIPIAGLGTMSIGMGFLASYWSPVRQCIAWCICISLFFAMMRYGEKAVADVLSQRQVQGSTEEIAGTNASAVSAVAYPIPPCRLRDLAWEQRRRFVSCDWDRVILDHGWQ